MICGGCRDIVSASWRNCYCGAAGRVPIGNDVAAIGIFPSLAKLQCAQSCGFDSRNRIQVFYFRSPAISHTKPGPELRDSERKYLRKTPANASNKSATVMSRSFCAEKLSWSQSSVLSSVPRPVKSLNIRRRRPSLLNASAHGSGNTSMIRGSRVTQTESSIYIYHSCFTSDAVLSRGLCRRSLLKRQYSGTGN